MKIKKKLPVLLLASLLTGSLASCSPREDSSTSTPSSEIETLQNYSLELNLKSVYSLGEIIDFSTSYIVKKEGDKETERISLLSNDVEINGVDTNTEGKKTLTIKYLDFSSSYIYEVITNYVTFKLNGGAIEDSSDDIRVALNNNFLDISTYRPIKTAEDGSNLVFSGWFYDEELTRRASYQLDTDFFSETSVTLYASYGYDYSSQFVYSINEKEHTCSLISINFDNMFDFMFSDELVIPKEIDGYAVTEIAQNIFTQYDPNATFGDPYYNWASMLSISKITFEEGSEIETIGSSAFEGLLTLNEVVLPSSLKVIGDKAFCQTGLNSILIPANTTKIGKGAFSYSVGAFSSVTFEEGSKLKIIDEGAFSYCEHLSNISLPDGLEEIRDGAFELCNEIETIRIPASVSLLSSGTFKQMESLRNIEVDENNVFYDSVDGHLYSKDKTNFIHYCFGNYSSSFTMPSYVKSIGDNAFNVFTGYSSLMNLVLPDSLTYIGKNAFSGCSFAINLPKSINSFSLGAFTNYDGNKIEVDPANTKYASKDGILYSKDFTRLFACPTQIEIDDFVLDDRVKIISEFAFVNVAGIKSFTIPETSNIEEFRKDSLLLTSFSNLAYFSYEPSRVPFFYESSFLERDYAYLTNTYFVMLFKHEEAKKYFENVLPNSETINPDYSFNFSFEMCTYDELISSIDSELTNYGFTSYDYYLNNRHLYLFGNSFEINLVSGISNRIYAAYRLGMADEQHLGYFSLYEKYLYNTFLTEYIRKDQIDYLNLLHFYRLVHRYDILPETSKSAVKDTMNLIETEFPFSNSFDELHNLYKEIIDFKIDANTFDKAAYKQLATKINAAYLWRRRIPTSVFKKMIYLQISDAIDEILNITDYTKENVSRIYTIINFEMSKENSQGLISTIDAYIKSETKQNEIYHYAEFEQFLERFNDPENGILVTYYKTLKDELVNYEFNPNDSEGALTFYNDTCSTLLSYFYWNLLNDGYTDGIDYVDMIYLLSLKIDMANYVKAYSVIDSTNVYSAKVFTDSVEKVLDATCFNHDVTYEYGNLDSVSDEIKNQIPGFDSFAEAYKTLNEYIESYVSTLTTKIETFELTKENLSSDSFLELYDLYVSLGSYVSELSDETNERFNLIYASYLINYVLDKFPAVDESNLIDFKIFYYGYFDFDTYETKDGISSYIAKALFDVADTSLIPNFDQYMTIISNMMEA